jgi:type I restriction enzyme R subunit
MSEENCKYNMVSENDRSTVVSIYKPDRVMEESYQTEAQLEREFIKLLSEQSYEYIKIGSEEDLVSNLRDKLQKLNDYTFSDNEWDNFFKNNISSNKVGVF